MGFRPFVPASWEPARAGTDSVAIAGLLAVSWQGWQVGLSADMRTGHPRPSGDAPRLSVARRYLSAATNARHALAVKVTMGPVRSVVSRTSTAWAVATSTQAPPLSPE